MLSSRVGFWFVVGVFFSSFLNKQGNSGFNFSSCISVTQYILTCFVRYALILYLLSYFCSEQTKNQALVHK